MWPLKISAARAAAKMRYLAQVKRGQEQYSHQYLPYFDKFGGVVPICLLR